MVKTYPTGTDLTLLLYVRFIDHNIKYIIIIIKYHYNMTYTLNFKARLKRKCFTYIYK